MFDTALIIDNNTLYTNKLKSKLENNLDLTCTVIKDYNSVEKMNNLNDYNLYYIRLDRQNHAVIKQLTKNNKIVILLTDRDDIETKDLIKSYKVNDYIVLNENSNGAVALRIANRLINNSKNSDI